MGGAEFVSAPSSPMLQPTPPTASGAVEAVGTHHTPPAKAAAPAYHPLSGLPKPGWAGALTAAHARALDELRSRARALGLWDGIVAAAVRPAEDEDGLLLRFLRARDFDVGRALAMLEADLAWRAAEGLAQLRAQSAEEVLGCDEAIVRHYLPAWVEGEDKQGRPGARARARSRAWLALHGGATCARRRMLCAAAHRLGPVRLALRGPAARAVHFNKQGDFRVDALLEYTTHERLVRFHTWEQERLMRRLGEQSCKHGCRVGQLVAVVDMNGWHPGLSTRRAMALVKENVRRDAAHYPERSGTAVLINVPYVFSFCWAIVGPLLDESTRAKVSLYSSPAHWVPALRALIDDEQLPVEYGGKREGVHMRDVTKPAPPPFPPPAARPRPK